MGQEAEALLVSHNPRPRLIGFLSAAPSVIVPVDAVRHLNSGRTINYQAPSYFRSLVEKDSDRKTADRDFVSNARARLWGNSSCNGERIMIGMRWNFHIRCFYVRVAIYCCRQSLRYFVGHSVRWLVCIAV
jgi:hypothetical protein